MNCTGHCCEAFSLPSDATERLLHEPEQLKDGMQIRDMLLPTGEEDRWTCVNFDKETRRCRIYDSRPQMCWEFPYRGSTCPFKGCTLSGEDLKAYR